MSTVPVTVRPASGMCRILDLGRLAMISLSYWLSIIDNEILPSPCRGARGLPTTDRSRPGQAREPVNRCDPGTTARIPLKNNKLSNTMYVIFHTFYKAMLCNITGTFSSPSKTLLFCVKQLRNQFFSLKMHFFILKDGGKSIFFEIIWKNDIFCGAKSNIFEFFIKT